MNKIQFRDSTGASIEPTIVQVPAGSLTGPNTVDLTDGGPGGFVEYAAGNSATENVFQIPDSASHLKDSIFSQNAGATAVLSSGNLAAAHNVIGGFVTTATAAGTTVLTVASNGTQAFTGATTQIITLPVVTTFPQTGLSYRIVNSSTGILTINSSGANIVASLGPNSEAIVTCILLTGTTAASWSVTYVQNELTYDVTLTQSATAAPVATIGHNNIPGTLTWAYVSPGIYTLTSNGTPFTANKTQIYFGPLPVPNTDHVTQPSAVRTSTSVITITLTDGDIGGGATAPANGLLTETAFRVVITV